MVTWKGDVNKLKGCYPCDIYCLCYIISYHAADIAVMYMDTADTTNVI